ncbi:hypothetical protein G6F40_014087 [Rhizopus arrhizus]|nr:hypothetical protein G6F40_014087 [Rhizopus arrhizus]
MPSCHAGTLATSPGSHLVAASVADMPMTQPRDSPMVSDPSTRQVAGVEHDRTAKPQEQVHPAHGVPAKAAEVQHEEGIDRRIPAAHVFWQVMCVHYASVRIEVGTHVGAGTGPVTDIQAGDTPLDHTALLLETQACRSRQRLGVRSGLGIVLFAPLDAVGINHLVLDVVDLIVEREYHAGYGHDQVERQADNAQRVVHIQPHALDVLAYPHGEEVFHQRRQQHDDAGDQCHGIHQRNDAHDGA